MSRVLRFVFVIIAFLIASFLIFSAYKIGNDIKQAFNNKVQMIEKIRDK